MRQEYPWDYDNKLEINEYVRTLIALTILELRHILDNEHKMLCNSLADTKIKKLK